MWIASVIGLLTVALYGGPALASTRHGTRHSGRPGRGQTGLDILEAQKFAPLRNKHVGLIKNHHGLGAEALSTADVLTHAAGVRLVALFSPEPGLTGRNDEKVSSTKDAATGL